MGDGVNDRLFSRLKERDLIEIKPIKNNKISVSLKIIQPNPNNYVQNIRILMPDGICKGNLFRRVMVKLANLTGANPWFNFQHRANNKDVRQYAEYVSKHLKPDFNPGTHTTSR